MLTLIAGSLGYRQLGVANGLACGHKRWQKVLEHLRKDVTESAPGESTSACATEAFILLQLGGRKCGALKLSLENC